MRQPFFDVDSGELLVRGLPGVDSTLVIGPNELIAVTEQTAQRVALDTLEPRSTLARATGGSWALDVSLDGRTLLNVGWNNRLTLYDLTRDIVLGEPIDTSGAGVAAVTSPPTARRWSRRCPMASCSGISFPNTRRSPRARWSAVS